MGAGRPTAVAIRPDGRPPSMTTFADVRRIALALPGVATLEDLP